MTNTETVTGHIQLAAGLIQIDTYGDMDASTAHRLAAFAELAARVEAEFRAEVQHARDMRMTWAEIGEALGTSRQAAHERFREHMA